VMNVDAARLVKAVVNVNPVSFVSVRRYGFRNLETVVKVRRECRYRPARHHSNLLDHLTSVSPWTTFRKTPRYNIYHVHFII